jgi:hypothetical protein
MRGLNQEKNNMTPEQALDFLYKATQNVSAVKAFHDQAIAAALIIKKALEEKNEQPKG